MARIDPGEKHTRTDRDPAVLRDGLQAWLSSHVDGQAEITAFEVPETNGMSSETLLFDLATDDGVQRYVARIPPTPSAVPVFPTYRLSDQVDVMRLVGDRSDVPVPTVPWFEPSTDAIGAPFFVMNHIDGQVPPDVMPYNMASWVVDATEEQRALLQEATVGVVAGIHSLDATPDEYAFLELERPEATPLRRHLADQWEYYRWVADDVRQPLVERAFTWLDEHFPSDEGDPVLLWGDARIGNILYQDFQPVAVLDWEMATVGPRELDLSWTIFLHRFFEDLAQEMEMPGLPNFLRAGDVATTYEALTGHAVRDLEWYLTYAALRHAVIMTRIAQRSIHFGEAEAPDDPDDLIMHRASLEAMLDGTYWSRL